MLSILPAGPLRVPRCHPHPHTVAHPTPSPPPAPLQVPLNDMFGYSTALRSATQVRWGAGAARGRGRRGPGDAQDGLAVIGPRLHAP